MLECIYNHWLPYWSEIIPRKMNYDSSCRSLFAHMTLFQHKDVNISFTLISKASYAIWYHFTGIFTFLFATWWRPISVRLTCNGCIDGSVSRNTGVCKVVHEQCPIVDAAYEMSIWNLRIIATVYIQIKWICQRKNVVSSVDCTL